VVQEAARVLRLSAGERKAAEPVDDELSPQPISPRLACWTGITRTIGLGLAGNTEAALASAARAWTALDPGSGNTETSFARAALMQGEVMALELDGRMSQAETRAVELHDATMARARSATDAVAARGRGSAALAAGRPAEAVRWLTEAATQLEESDPIGCLQLCRAQLAQAHGLLGDPDAAARVLTAGPAPSSVRAFEPQTFLAEAWRHAAAHHVSKAGEAAMRAAASAADMEQWAVEAWALQTAARLGLAAEVSRRLRDLADEIGSRTVRAFAAHAAAAAGSLGDSLDEVAEEFGTLGAQALAADAFAQAAEAHRNAGHRRRAAAAGVRASALALSGGGLRTPALDRLAPYSLTRRERELASLAAEGVSNQGIAERLVLSVRTVETHLAHVYDKLGINGRAALREALSPHDRSPHDRT
jgi:ATP/maltotriose-dependent transcriptional regulator MalT